MPKQSTRGGPRPGAGRPKIYKELGPPISVRLEADVQAALDAVCAARGISRTKGLQEAVRLFTRGKR